MENTVSRKKYIGLIIAAFLLYALSGGFRANYGIIINPISDFSGCSYADVSFVFGIAQLVYGLAQPFWGALALRKSNATVLMLGLICFAVGLVGTAFSHTLPLMLIFFGIIFASGTGAVCFGIIMGAITPAIGTKRAAAASGIVNASAGLGGAALSPTMQMMDEGIGIFRTLLIFAVIAVLMILVVLWVRSNGGEGSTESIETRNDRNIRSTLSEAFKNADYRKLMIGFATCGFHMTIIQTHLVTQIVHYGISEITASVIYTAYGVAVMAGAIASGLLCSKFHLKNVLGSFYGTRAIIVAAFLLLMPKTLPFIVLFALVLGFTGDATVTPTSEIISRRFGAETMGLLFGITFVCHQIGGFISSWLGGILIQGFGNYHLIWYIDIITCAIAAIASYRISIGVNE